VRGGRLAGISLTAPWWVAGGWALDLFLGFSTRPHKDLDIGIARRDVSTVCRSLNEWEFHEARAGTLTPLTPGDAPRAEVNSLAAIRRTAIGIRYLAPEIQLLYKARPIRNQDQLDCDRVAGGLDRAAREWLRASLASMDPHHVWLSLL
jgi:hypothetical protein